MQVISSYLFWALEISFKANLRLTFRVCVCVCVSTTWMLRVSFSHPPECVDADCWSRSFSPSPTPPHRHQEHGCRCSCCICLYKPFYFIYIYIYCPSARPQTGGIIKMGKKKRRCQDLVAGSGSQDLEATGKASMAEPDNRQQCLYEAARM